MCMVICAASYRSLRLSSSEVLNFEHIHPVCLESHRSGYVQAQKDNHQILGHVKEEWDPAKRIIVGLILIFEDTVIPRAELCAAFFFPFKHSVRESDEHIPFLLCLRVKLVHIFIRVHLKFSRKLLFRPVLYSRLLLRVQICTDSDERMVDNVTPSFNDMPIWNS